MSVVICRSTRSWSNWLWSNPDRCEAKTITVNLVCGLWRWTCAANVWFWFWQIIHSPPRGVSPGQHHVTISHAVALRFVANVDLTQMDYLHFLVLRKDKNSQSNTTATVSWSRIKNNILTLYMGTLKPQSNGPLYSNTVIGTLAADGWAVTFGTARRGLGGLRPAQSPLRCTKCNSSPISGHFTNFIFDVAL